MITCTDITNSYITITGISIVYRKTDSLEVSCFVIFKSMLSYVSLLFMRQSECTDMFKRSQKTIQNYLYKLSEMILRIPIQ